MFKENQKIRKLEKLARRVILLDTVPYIIIIIIIITNESLVLTSRGVGKCSGLGYVGVRGGSGKGHAPFCPPGGM